MQPPPPDLHDLRLSKGKMQADLGCRRMVSRIEHGQVKPGARLIARMAKALGVSTEAVFAACCESWRRAHPDDPWHGMGAA